MGIKRRRGIEIGHHYIDNQQRAAPARDQFAVEYPCVIVLKIIIGFGHGNALPASAIGLMLDIGGHIKRKAKAQPSQLHYSKGKQINPHDAGEIPR